MRILIVDDSNTIHLYIKGLLGTDRYSYEDAFDGREAVDMVKSGLDVDAIFLDWEMPSLNGLDALAEIREIDQSIPIIMVTTKNEPELMGQAFDLGASEYVMKPFTKEILIERLGMVTGKEVA